MMIRLNWILALAVAACGTVSKDPLDDGGTGMDGVSGGDGDGGDEEVDGALPSTLIIAPETVDFGNVPTGVTTEPVTLVVTNEGAGPSGALAVTIEGDPAFAVTTDECGGNTLEPAQSCTILVTFAPTAFGAVSGTLHVDGGSPALQVPLGGNGISPDGLIFTPSTHDYGTFVLGVTSPPPTRAFTLTNGATFTTGTLTIATSGAAFDITGNTCGSTLGPGGNCSVTVRFSPSTVGVKSGELTATASPGGTATAPLSGTATLRPNGTACSAADQCTSGVCTTFYRDGDSDTYAPSGATATQLCGATVAGYATRTGDCCDSDSNSRPNQTGWPTTISNCSGVGWNHDCGTVAGVQFRYNGSNGCTESGGCATGSAFCSGPGWSGSMVQCGNPGTYRTCSTILVCNQSTCPGCEGCSTTTNASVTQGCH
jgi:hypothetical protein